MSVVINTNSDALRIQGTLTSATNKLSQTMQRMSSGLKINSAKDDAAGTVISARMAVQLDGNQICQKNIQNANSLLSTAEGNVDVVLDNIVRIRDLTLQAKNGTYSKEEKAAMQAEVAQRISEIDRVSDSAKYSQLKLFGDSDANGLYQAGATFQVGANSSVNDTIVVESGVGEDGKDTGKSIFASVKFTDILTQDVAAVTAETVSSVDAANVGTIKDTGISFKDGILYKDKTEIARADLSSATTKNGDTDTKGKIVKETTGSGESAVTKYYVCTAAKDGETAATYEEIKNEVGKSTEEQKGVKSYTSNEAFDISTMTQDDFVKALDSLDSAIDNLTARKSTIGSLGNRFDSALDTLTTQYTNLTSAKSVITDADIASEASAFTQNQILQQVATSLLTQANQTPSIALSLL